MERSIEGTVVSRWGFGSGGPLRDRLTALALAGRKTATASLLVDYELDGEMVPKPGDRQVLIDTRDQAIAVVESVSAHVVRLADVDDQYAIDEGEGYANAAEFRVAHEQFWNGELDRLRDGLGDPSFDLTDDTLIVAERFRVLEIVDDAGSPLVPSVGIADPRDRAPVDAFLAEHNSDMAARQGELVDARREAALIIKDDAGGIAGVLTWILDGDSMEILTLHTARQWAGGGSALLTAARRVAEAIGARRLWLITTNDNTDALRFYQRRGFRLARVDAGAVDRSRAALKPGIPGTGLNDVPIRDELVLELSIRAADATPSPSIADRLLALELALARRDEASIPGGFEAVLAADFTEIGASGRFWTRAETLAALEHEPRNDAISIDSFTTSDLAHGIVLAQYDAMARDLDGDGRVSRRTSIWAFRDGRWQLVFNQETPVGPELVE
jgi:uncharacterized protein YhfF/N-acetylglutamate synthase-like GNAT family acetyltransferase